MSFQAPKGTFDISPFLDTKDKWKWAHLWEHIETVTRRVAQRHQYYEIRTPIFEKTALFTRSSGETSDIVFKEMYTFKDKGDRSMTLRPEGTASALRSVIENRLDQQKLPLKIFYTGPYFRYDRPQAGRYRQFHQFGAECIGLSNPVADVETLLFLKDIFDELGVMENCQLLINTLGTKKSREAYAKALIGYLTPKQDFLSADSQMRMKNNPLRILDSKSQQDKEALKGAPTLNEYLDEESLSHFRQVKELLTSLDIPFVIDDRLVRGLDYYNHTVFEITTSSLGAQSTVGAGGRYDGLIKTLGGPDLPASGFAFGIERALMTMIHNNSPLPELTKPDILIVPLGYSAQGESIKLASNLRKEGLNVELYTRNQKVSKALEYADKHLFQHCIFLGEEEIKKQVVKVRNMKDKSETTCDLAKLPSKYRVMSGCR